MLHSIFATISKFGFFLKRISTKKFVSTALVVLLLLTTNVAPTYSKQGISKKLDEVVHRDDSQRPKTTGEWKQEAQETEGAPGKRLKRIGKESAEAVKDFGAVYPDTAQKSISELRSSSEMNK